MRLFFTIGVLALLLACSPSEPPPPPGVESEPRIGGKWVTINYWAIWCYPCRAESPELNEFARERAEDMIVYAVNFDGARGEELLVQAAELGIEFPLLATDPAPALGYARPTVLPTTLVFNPRGELWARLLGPQTRDSLEAAMESKQQKLSPPTEGG
jgi:thiol-disulfide isomerase/thioredoxin